MGAVILAPSVWASFGAPPSTALVSVPVRAVVTFTSCLTAPVTLRQTGQHSLSSAPLLGGARQLR